MLSDFLAFMVVGFLAQLVDGALGMGFGVISSSILLAQGVPPALASASVNAAKLPTTGTAALSHAYHRNINWNIARKLCLFGSVGGIIGALLLTSLKGVMLAYLVNSYLAFIGILIVYRGFMNCTAPHSRRTGENNRAGRRSDRRHRRQLGPDCHDWPARLRHRAALFHRLVELLGVRGEHSRLLSFPCGLCSRALARRLGLAHGGAASGGACGRRATGCRLWRLSLEARPAATIDRRGGLLSAGNCCLSGVLWLAVQWHGVALAPRPSFTPPPALIVGSYRYRDVVPVNLIPLRRKLGRAM